MAEHRDVLREHEFDGIVEYDNEVPRWLAAIFYGSVIWAVGYLLWFHLGGGVVGVDAYERERLAVAERLAAQSTGIPDEPVLRQLSHNAGRVAAGREVFFGPGKCTTCHGADGLGQIGPNLRDDRWKHGSDMSDIVESLVDGRAGGQMPPQRGVLSQEEIVNLAAFLADWNRSEKANGRGVVKDGEVEDPIDY